MIDHKLDLDKSFQDILKRIDNGINEGSGWFVESIVSQYINISTYRPLSGGSYIKLPVELKSPKKDQHQNNDQKFFLWCHVRHINPVKINPEGITRKDKELVNDLSYRKIKFPVSKETFSETKTKKSNLCINVFCYENKLTFPIYISDKKI